MWITKTYWSAMIRQQNELERRVKRLELLAMRDAENKIASLRDNKAGSITSDGTLTIEEIINQ